MDRKYIIENFNSIEEMIKILKTRPKNNIMKDRNSSEDSSYSFTNTNSYEEAEELIKNGYIEILNKIKSGLKFNVTENSKTIPENNVFGYIPNVPNAIMNLPKSMIYQKRIPRKVSTIDLIYCSTSNSGTGSDSFIKNGIKILNIINSLEQNNIRVNLKAAVFDGETNNEKCLATVNLKNYKEKLNLQKICFPIAHPSMLRRFGFKWLETTSKITNDNWQYGYGKSIKDYSGFPIDSIILSLDEINYLNEEEIINEKINCNL